jgi:hypothetical protein
MIAYPKKEENKDAEQWAFRKAKQLSYKKC